MTNGFVGQTGPLERPLCRLSKRGAALDPCKSTSLTAENREGPDLFITLLEQQSDPVQLIEINEIDAGNVTALAVWLKIIHYFVMAETHELHLYEMWCACRNWQPRSSRKS